MRGHLGPTRCTGRVRWSLGGDGGDLLCSCASASRASPHLERRGTSSSSPPSPNVLECWQRRGFATSDQSRPAKTAHLIPSHPSHPQCTSSRDHTKGGWGQRAGPALLPFSLMVNKSPLWGEAQSCTGRTGGTEVEPAWDMGHGGTPYPPMALHKQKFLRWQSSPRSGLNTIALQSLFPCGRGAGRQRLWDGRMGYRE